MKNIKDVAWQKEHRKKKGYFTAFWKKDQNNKNIPYTNEDLGDELVIVVIDNDKSGLLLFQMKRLSVEKFYQQKTTMGKCL